MNRPIHPLVMGSANRFKVLFQGSVVCMAASPTIIRPGFSGIGIDI